jgi:hypothetical protein
MRLSLLLLLPLTSGCFAAVADPTAPAPIGTYVPLTDPEAVLDLQARVWNVLRGSPCWVSTGDPLETLGFEGSDHFLYRGPEDHSGEVVVDSIGWYGDRPAVSLETWRPTPDLIVIVRDDVIAQAPRTTFLAAPQCPIR